jgi:hypothetical protein
MPDVTAEQSCCTHHITGSMLGCRVHRQAVLMSQGDEGRVPIEGIIKLWRDSTEYLLYSSQAQNNCLLLASVK